MPHHWTHNWFGIDHKLIVKTALVLTSGWAAYATYRMLMRERQKKNDTYETQKLLHEYLVFHYGSPEEVLSWEFGPKEALDFPKRCAELCKKHFDNQDGVPKRALDIGCAVGRSSFELATDFDSVTGIDYSQSFVDSCNRLKEDGVMAYYVNDEGDIQTDLVARVNPAIERQKVLFQQGDATNLPLDLGQFGCVLAANLVDRLGNPCDFLNRLPNLVASGGVAVLTSPYTWLAEWTPRENWLGGFYDENKQPVTTFQTLKRVLGADFELIAEENMPFFIRETARKNQWTVAHATVWRRK